MEVACFASLEGDNYFKEPMPGRWLRSPHEVIYFPPKGCVWLSTTASETALILGLSLIHI